MGLTVLDEPVVTEQGGEETVHASPWNVILYNDDHHTINEVILQIQKATGASPQTAFEITMEAHTKGKAVCFSGVLDECERVATILREIKLTVAITQGG